MGRPKAAHPLFSRFSASAGPTAWVPFPSASPLPGNFDSCTRAPSPSPPPPLQPAAPARAPPLSSVPHANLDLRY